MPNIKINFKSAYYKIITWSISFLITVYFCTDYEKYYVIHYAFNYVLFTYWFCADIFDYCGAYVVWGIIFLLSLSLNLLYSYLFFNNFSDNVVVEKIFSSNIVARIHAYPYPVNRYSKIFQCDLTKLANIWLAQRNGRSLYPTMKALFEPDINKNWWKKNHNFFLRAFRAAVVLNLTTTKQETFITTEGVNALSDLYLKHNPFGICPYYITPCYAVRYLRSIGWMKEATIRPYFRATTVNFSFSELLKILPDPDARNLNTEMEKIPFLLKTKTGFFFFSDFDYQKLNYLTSNFYELINLHPFIKNQLELAKWNRWLYRYSILHRKVLKNSHKLTLSKRLLNSGFYNSQFFEKNIWNNKFFGRNVNNQLFSNFFDLYYNNFFFIKNNKNYLNKTQFTYNNKNQIINLNHLSFYEYSYFWFLKRFYLFNTMPNNFIKSTFKINEKYSMNLLDSSVKTENFDNYFFINNTLLKTSFNFSNKSFSFFNNVFNQNNTHKNYALYNNNKFNNKNIYLNLNDIDLFSNDNSLTLLQIISNFIKNNDFIFYNYASIRTNYNINVNSLFLHNLSENNLNLIFRSSFERSNEPQNADVDYTTLFY